MEKKYIYRVALGWCDPTSVRAVSPDKALEALYAEAGITRDKHGLEITQVWSGGAHDATTKRHGEILEYWSVEYNL